MNKEFYERLTNPIHKHSNGVRAIKLINSIITGMVYCIYPILLLILLLAGDERFWKVFIVPAISFILLSLIRKRIDAPRPYETLDIDPIIKKDTRGNSFPSRHVFSVFIIATLSYYVSVALGTFLIFIGIILAMIRVIGGVHFPRDVIAGATFGILSGLLGIWI